MPINDEVFLLSIFNETIDKFYAVEISIDKKSRVFVDAIVIATWFMSRDIFVETFVKTCIKKLIRDYRWVVTTFKRTNSPS